MDKKIGRPKSKIESENVTIKCPKNVINKLRKISNSNYCSMSHIIRESINKYLKAQD
jgi:metal-responsive CopG/Arc/MetJ family transcriptional regulator